MATNQDIILQQRAHANVLIATLTTEPEVIERGLSIDRIIDRGTPLSVLIRTSEKKTVKQILDINLTKMVASFNLNLNLKDYQIGQIIEDLIEKYPNETIEDFIYVFKQARQGAYGQVFRIDSAVIFGWMALHLEEKYNAVERKLMAEKDKPYEIVEKTKEPLPIEKADVYIQEMLRIVSEVDSKKIVPLSDNQIKEEGKEAKSTGYRPYFRKEDEIHHRRWYKEMYPGATDHEINQWIKGIVKD